MGREVLIAALCWFTIGECQTSLRDSIGSPSVSRLYGSLPRVGVYASAAPYGAYSFSSPIIAAPSRIVPSKEIYNFQNMNAHLRDSYGNRFVETKQTPQAVPFKPFPQQYVPLQELPAHFAQPIAAPAFPGIKQVQAPQLVYGSQYKLPLQSLQSTPLGQQAAYSYSQGIQHVPSTQQATYPISQGVSSYVNNLNNLRNLSPHPVAHTQFRGPLIHLPVPGQAFNRLPAYSSKPLHYGSNIIHNQNVVTPIPTAQQQSSSNEAIYANSQSNDSEEEPKYHREQPRREESSEEDEVPIRQIVRHKDTIQQKVPFRETTVTSFHDGVKTSVNLKTKPPLPLLDINLLEPLTFDNPLVPQVQHFLPKLSQATYSKLPGSNVVTKKQKPVQKAVIQKPKIYESDSPKVKPKKVAPKKKPGYPRVQIQNIYYDEVASASTARPAIANESPEIIYEIDTPNHKETYTEKKINYNKEIKSEPVHITYGSQKKEEPLHYTYVHSSKEPVHIKEVHYEGKGEGPKPHVNKIKPQQDGKYEKKYHHESEDSGESAEDEPLTHYHSDHHDDEQNSKHHSHHHNKPTHNELQHHHHENGKHHESPKAHSQKPEHREEEHHHPSNNKFQNEQDIPAFKPIQYYTKTSSGTFRPINDYEEEIRVAAPIKVNPSQQHQPEFRPQYPSHQAEHSSNSHYSGPQHDSNSHKKHNTPTAKPHEKVKSVVIETPETSEQDHTGKFGHDEDTEKEFETAYKNAAFGFPAYDKSADIEKGFFNPESFGPARDHNNYDFKNSPLEQYQSQSDSYPKSMRLSYKELMDKMKGDYFTDLSISKPESIADYYKKKTDYYKLYKNQKPEKYIALNNESLKKEKTNEKYSALPYSFYPTPDMNMKQLIAQYKATPFVQEIDYSKGLPRDNSAHSTQPFQRYKSNTFFVEPQFQYGFEPLSLPKLFDSELATMASNNSPESENPGTRKKFYKENFYIKKTSTDAGPSS